MPISVAHYTLGTAAATQIVAPDNQPQHVVIHEADHSESTEAILGGPGVTALTGLHLHAASTLQFEIGPEDELWGISGQGAPVLHVMTINKAD